MAGPRWRPGAAQSLHPIAEETGLIVPLGEWVLRTACRQMQKWIAEGTALEAISVNVSPRQFQESNLCERIRSILAETGLPPQRLELEITESTLLDHAKVEPKLAILKALGIKISIDDFGTGYSSLASLKYFSVDRLKIDQSFVRDISGSTTALQIISAIIALAKSLKLEVLAEGVEAEHQLTSLRALGCDTGQGFLFSRPVSSDQFDAARHGSGGAGPRQPSARGYNGRLSN